MHLQRTEHDYDPEWNEVLLSADDDVYETANRIEAKIEAMQNEIS